MVLGVARLWCSLGAFLFRLGDRVSLVSLELGFLSFFCLVPAFPAGWEQK